MMMDADNDDDDDSDSDDDDDDGEQIKVINNHWFYSKSCETDAEQWIWDPAEHSLAIEELYRTLNDDDDGC